MKENPHAVPGTWNTGTNYADSRYQLPQIDNNRIGKIVYANPSTLPDGTKLPPVPVCTASHLGNGQWITAEHCLRDFSSFHGYIEQSDGERAQVTKTEAIGKETDIALLQTGPGIEADSFTLASEPARPGDTLFLLGFADNHPYSSLAVVKVQQLLSKVKIDRYSYRNVYRTTSASKARSCSGDSGGPVFSGEVLFAVHTAGEKNVDCTDKVGASMWHSDISNINSEIIQRMKHS